MPLESVYEPPNPRYGPSLGLGLVDTSQIQAHFGPFLGRFYNILWS